MYAEHFTPEEMSDRLAYDPLTGVLTWKKCRDSRKIGTHAKSIDVSGYVQVNVAGKVMKGHRIAWAIHHGAWPKGQIDHVNGNRSDNRIENLRCVDNQTNCQNQRNGSRKNETGFLGVHIGRGCESKRFRAKIQFEGKQLHLGGYPTAEEAHQAYIKAKRDIHKGGVL